jgi:hypothetical protein
MIGRVPFIVLPLLLFNRRIRTEKYLPLKDVFRAGHEVGSVDVYFDPKSLKSQHAEARRTLRELLVSEARRYASRLHSRFLRKLKIRQIEPVKKPITGAAPDKFQMETWVADKLCSHSERILRMSGDSRITTYDMSGVVRRSLQQFDGKSFHDD